MKRILLSFVFLSMGLMMASAQVVVQKKTKAYEIDIVFDSYADAPEINQRLKTIAQKLESGLTENASDNDVDDMFGPLTVQASTNSFRTGRYLNVTVNGYEYGGGAHGIPIIVNMIYDTQKKQILEKNEVVDVTKERAINELIWKYRDAGWWNECADESLFNPSTLEFVDEIMLTPKGVTFLYEVYNVGPYACGELAVEIPYEVIRPYLLLDL